jgi:threonine dehydrogenase-like Zn-dependent dehydrogenase
MLEPLGVAHNGIERLEVKDEDVLVIGCGPVGLLAQRVAKVMGAKRYVKNHVQALKHCP